MTDKEIEELIDRIETREFYISALAVQLLEDSVNALRSLLAERNTALLLIEDVRNERNNAHIKARREISEEYEKLASAREGVAHRAGMMEAADLCDACAKRFSLSPQTIPRSVALRIAAGDIRRQAENPHQGCVK